MRLALLLAPIALLHAQIVPRAVCTPTPIVPYVQVGTATWQQLATATVAAVTTVVNLGPQPIGGTWGWTGPNNFASTARELDGIALSVGANNYIATYTNASGCKSTQTFTITVTAPPPTVTCGSGLVASGALCNVDTSVILSRATDVNGSDHWLAVTGGPVNWTAETGITVPAYVQGNWWLAQFANGAGATINLGPGILPLLVKGTPVVGGECTNGCILQAIGSPPTALAVH